MVNRLLIVASFDSQLKVCSHIANEFVQQGWNLTVRSPHGAGKQPNLRQIEEYSEFTEIEFCSLDPQDILQGSDDYAAILLIVDGMLTQLVCQYFFSTVAERKPSRRPVMITGFVGVGLFDVSIGYQRRLVSDVLFLNAAKDLEDCQDVCKALGVDHGGLVVSGLPFLGAIDTRPQYEPVKTVLFAGQPDVPGRVIERVYMLERMLEYATNFPDRKVYFKPRHKPGEKTLHPTRYHYEVLLASFLENRSIPCNFEFVYGPIGDLLKDTQLFITVSSTAVFEALEYGCRVALLSDLGITENFGNEYFMGSGMLCHSEKLLNDDFTCVNWDWLHAHMALDGLGPERVYAATVRAIENNSTSCAVPYSLENLQRHIATRIDVESRNVKDVRSPLAYTRFYLTRLLMEKRLL